MHSSIIFSIKRRVFALKREIEVRVLNEAYYLIKNKGTVRSLAAIFGVSKSTVHYDLACRLKKLDLDLYNKTDNLLKINLKDRHIRGGKATKNKYEKMRKNCQKLTKNTN